MNAGQRRRCVVMPNLTAAQLAWCRTEIRSFAPAEASVLRRDADVAANRAYFRERAVVTPEGARHTTEEISRT